MKDNTETTIVIEKLKTRDLHIHTPYCNHAEGEMEEYVRSAVKIGLDEIGFLEHVELGVKTEKRSWMRLEDIAAYWEKGRELGRRYGDEIKVSLGLEVGINKDMTDELLEIINSRPWDHIGLSCHLLPYKGDMVNICSRTSCAEVKEADQRDLTIQYYRLLRDHIGVIEPDFVCHLDVPRKFMKDFSGDEEVMHLILETLDEMARAGTALEVNTSGYNWFGSPYPDARILRQAASRGLNLVLNSDSHHPSEVGRFFDKALSYIEEALK